MTYLQLAYLHLATVVPAFLLGTWLLMSRKGTPTHRAIGKVYMLLMLITASVSLFMPAEVGPQFLGHFGFIHLLAILVLYTVPAAYIAARAGRRSTHQKHMIGLYVGGILIAGTFALMPGRLLHGWIWG